MKLSSFNPFRGLPNPREVWAWGMYDFANQSFTLLIITLLFSLYVQQVVTPRPEFTPEQREAIAQVDAGEAEPDDQTRPLLDQREAADARGKWNWSMLHGGSLVLVVVLSPLLGALADARGWRKGFLVGTGIGCSALTCALGLIPPEGLLLAALLYIPASLCYQIGENFLASFLPDVSTPRTMGRISATGWAMGYLGALLLLLITLAGMLAFGWLTPDRWRPFFVLAGLWFLVGMLPAALILHGDAPVERTSGRGLLGESFGRLIETARHARRYRHLCRFLVAFLVYGFGVQVIIGFASIIAAGFGFGQTELVIFVAQLTVVAGLTAIVTARFQDRIGAKATVFTYLIVWLISTLLLVGIKLTWPNGGPQWPLWVVGNGLGIGLGGIGTASRTLLARFTPRHRRAEFFGLWGMTYKLAAAVGVLSFGAVAAVFGELASLLLLAGFFVAGIVLLLRVSEPSGLLAARRAERAFGLLPLEPAPAASTGRVGTDTVSHDDHGPPDR